MLLVMWLDTHYMPNTVAMALFVYSCNTVFSTNTVTTINVNPSLWHQHQPKQFIGVCYLNYSQWRPCYYVVFWSRKVRLKFRFLSGVRWFSPHPHILSFRIHFDIMYSGIYLSVSQENNYLQLQSGLMKHVP